MLVLRSLAPITEEKKPNKKTLAFIKKLQISEEYKIFQRNRPPHAVSLKEDFGKYFSSLQFSQEEMQLFGSMPDFNLFSESEHTIEDVMVLAYLYDAVIDLRYIKKPSSPLAMLATKKQLLLASTHYPGDLLGILLPFRMSQQELLLWIKENWSDLQAEMSKLDTFTPTYLSKNLEVGREIEELKNNGLTFKQISVELEKKYPGDERFLSYNHVSAIHQQYRKYWKESESSINSLRILKNILKLP